jgi:hypothetical protein
MDRDGEKLMTPEDFFESILPGQSTLSQVRKPFVNLMIKMKITMNLYYYSIQYNLSRTKRFSGPVRFWFFVIFVGFFLPSSVSNLV